MIAETVLFNYICYVMFCVCVFTLHNINNMIIYIFIISIFYILYMYINIYIYILYIVVNIYCRGDMWVN